MLRKQPFGETDAQELSSAFHIFVRSDLAIATTATTLDLYVN